MTGDMAAGNFAHAGADELNNVVNAVNESIDGVIRQLSQCGGAGIANSNGTRIGGDGDSADTGGTGYSDGAGGINADGNVGSGAEVEAGPVTGGCACVLGVGHDVVDVAAFTEQLNESGSRMRGLFSPRELRQASLRARQKNDGEAVHLAVRWAGKEAVLKAWCGALGRHPYPYTVDNFPWSSVEILDDSRGCPHVALAAEVEERLVESLAASDTGNNGDEGGNGHQKNLPMAGTDTLTPRWLISLTHDGPIASAVVLLIAQ